MSFFDRLVNVGKGYASLLQKDEDPRDRERLLERELAQRRPPPKAEPAEEPTPPPADPTPRDELGLPKERKRSL